MNDYMIEVTVQGVAAAYTMRDVAAKIREMMGVMMHRGNVPAECGKLGQWVLVLEERARCLQEAIDAPIPTST